MVILLDYIWIDVDNKTRSKTKIIYDKDIISYLDCPNWTFDGSSTGQAIGNNSDIILKPVAIYKDPFRKHLNYISYLVLCEIYNNNNSVHETNHRKKCLETANLTLNLEPWFGIEQEYVIYKEDIPYLWYNDVLLHPPCQDCTSKNSYYCGVGGNISFGRNIVEEHMDACLYAGIKICGINAEVMPSQWEFQIGILDPISVCDQLWVARYILDRIAEKYNCWINYHPKPDSNWNGSGCHTNFSTKLMRNDDNKIIEACEKLRLKHMEHINVYGKDNDKRLTGKNETSKIDEFSYAVSHRGCSIRIPLIFNNNKYIEDRRPAANMNPYLVIEKILNTTCL